MAGIIDAVFGRGYEAKTTDISNYLSTMLFGGWRSKSGITISPDRALQCTTALACVQALACGLGMMPGEVLRERADGGFDKEKDHPLWDVLCDQPNAWQTPTEWIETMMIHAVLCGNGLSFINRGVNSNGEASATGTPRELIPLRPDQVTLLQEPDYSLTYTVAFASGRSMVVPKENIFHLRAPSWNSYSGMDATRMAREAIGLALATEETHARLHSNGVNTTGVLSTDSKLGKDDIELLRETFAQSNGGVANSAKPLVLANGLTWTPVSMNGVDAQHLETRRMQIEEVCRAFGVFPAIIGHSDKTSTFASAEQFFLAHVIHSLGRWVKRFEERVQVNLMSKAERKAGLRFNLETRALLRGDHASRAAFYTALCTLGIMTRNEARLDEGWNPLQGLDAPLVPLNLGTEADRAAAAKEVANAVKSMMNGHDEAALEMKIGRALSAANERRIVGARNNLNEVLKELEPSNG
jgi:HK97 family phage portal protein